MENYLTNDDLSILIEALTEWENKDAFGGLLGGLVGAMITEKTPEAKAKWEEEQRNDEAKRAVAKKERIERSILLKAKLVMLRPTATANEVDHAWK